LTALLTRWLSLISDLMEVQLSWTSFDRWKKYKPRTLKDDYYSARPIEYWLAIRNKYPNLAHLAIDVFSVSASSCDCECMFSESGDLLEPRRRLISSQLLAAIQCVRSWIRAGFRKPSQDAAPLLADDAVDAIYNLCEWDSSTQQFVYTTNPAYTIKPQVSINLQAKVALTE
jgi:hypothetical protein